MSFGILPIEDIKSCVVSADKSADQNVADVPSEKTIVNDCDLISREDAIETVQSYLNILIDSRRHGDDVTLINVLTDIRNKISALPSAEPNKISVNVEYDVEYLPDKDGIHQAKATITKAEPVCETCRHNDKEWYSAECDSCCGNNSHYEPSDLISKQLLIGAIEKCGEEKIYPQALIQTIKAVPSADRQTDESCQDCPIYSADKPTVIKSKTLMPTKDFKEWAKRIREVNPNAVVIPCDAEVMSADRPKGEWGWTRGGQCSECGFHNTNFDFNFCPRCGADVRGEDDG